MRYIKTAIVSLMPAGCTAALSGCASISKNECEAGNWGDMGYRSVYYDGRTVYDAEQARLRLVEGEHDRLHDAVRDTEREIYSVTRRPESGTLARNEVYRLEKKLGRLEERLRYRIKDLRAFERGNGLDYCY